MFIKERERERGRRERVWAGDSCYCLCAGGHSSFSFVIWNLENSETS